MNTDYTGAPTPDAADAQASLEAVLKDEIIRMYEEVAVSSFAGVGPTGNVIGVDLNPSMCLKAQANAAANGTTMECHEGRMEDIPLPDSAVDVVISNGVVNLSFRKRRVVEAGLRVTALPGSGCCQTTAPRLSSGTPAYRIQWRM